MFPWLCVSFIYQPMVLVNNNNRWWWSKVFYHYIHFVWEQDKVLIGSDCMTLIAMKTVWRIEPEWLRLSALDKFVPHTYRQTDISTAWSPNIGAKKTTVYFNHSNVLLLLHNFCTLQVGFFSHLFQSCDNKKRRMCMRKSRIHRWRWSLRRGHLIRFSRDQPQSEKWHYYSGARLLLFRKMLAF